MIHEQHAVEILRSSRIKSGTEGACIIGSVTTKGAGLVTMRSAIGGERLVDMPSGEQLPRIC